MGRPHVDTPRSRSLSSSLGEATRCPKNRSDSHHPKMQFVEKQIVDESIDEVGCNSG